MAMNKTVLATAIKNALKAAHPEITGTAETLLVTEWELIANEIINHIKANAVITITALPSTGTVTSGAGAGGAVSVTGSGAVGAVTA